MDRSPKSMTTAGFAAPLATLALAAFAVAQEPTPALELPTPPVAVENLSAPETVVPADADSFRPLAPIPMPEMTHQAFDPHLPAVTESTGTWLRRGLWFADAEAVIMSRIWNNNNFTLVGEDEIPVPVNNVNTIRGSGNPAGVEGEIGESSAGWEGMPRFTLGRFLFRDAKNRDHTVEMVAMGGGEWNDAVGVVASATNGLFVPDSIDEGRISFEGATSSEFEYSSRFYNFEWNYQVTDRLSKDRMELQPNGQWIRRAKPGVTRHYLAGLRYVDLEENVDWSATDILNVASSGFVPPPIPFTADSGEYRVLASNNLFGPQVGAGITLDADRWNVSMSGKFGALINDARATGALSFENPLVADSDFRTEASENTVSYFAQWDLTARYHLRPNLSLRFGLEVMHVTAVALAPNQLNFNPASTSIGVSGDVWYGGITMGSEYYW